MPLSAMSLSIGGAAGLVSPATALRLRLSARGYTACPRSIRHLFRSQSPQTQPLVSPPVLGIPSYPSTTGSPSGTRTGPQLSSDQTPRTALSVTAAVQTRIRVGDLFVHRPTSNSVPASSAPVHSVNVTTIPSPNHHFQRSATIKPPPLPPLLPPPPLFLPTFPTSLCMSGPALSHSQAAPRALAPTTDPALPASHSIHSRIPSDDLFPFPNASASLSPASSSQLDGAQQHMHSTDASMFDIPPLATAADSSAGSPIAPQPRSHFASVATESNSNSTVGPVSVRALNTHLAADGAYSTDRNDMTQFLAFQDMDAQNLGATGAASPPTTASPSFQGSPASWTPELDGNLAQQNILSQPQLFPQFADLHHPQHQLPRAGDMNSATAQSPIGLDLMTTFSGYGALGGNEGDYFLSPWTSESGNVFQMEPPRSPYEMGLGEDFDMNNLCKEQEQLHRLMSSSSPPSAHVEPPLLFTQGNASSPFFPETPPPLPAHRLPFPIHSPDDQSPSPGITPRDLELPPRSAGGLNSSPGFAPASASVVSPPRWFETFDVPRSQALNIKQPGSSSPNAPQMPPSEFGFIPPPPLTTGPVPMPMPFSQTRHGHHHPYAGSRGHASSSLTLAELFQPASAPPHAGADFHTRHSRVRTYSQRTGSALRDALRAEAFASGNASRSQPRHSQGLPNDDSSVSAASALLSIEGEQFGQQHGGVGGVDSINLQGGMDMGDNMSTIRGSAFGIGGVDTDATVRKKRRTSARLPTSTPSPRSRMHSLPRDTTPASEASVDRERDLPQRSELRPPKLAPSTWQLYFTDWIQRHQSMSGGDKKLNVAQAAKEAGQEYAKLTPAQKEPFKRRSQAAKELRERELADWQRTLTPEDIKRENMFRAAQRKAGKSRKANLKDPNAPKKPLSAYFMFLQHIRSDPALVQNVFGDEKETTNQSVLAAEKWRSMSDEERKPFLARAEKEKLEYEAARRLYEDGTVGFESTISFNVPESSGQEGATFVISRPAAEHGSDYEADNEGFVTDEERHHRERPYRA